ncbi:unnamed protein product [Soboliphyme baturini]|uniref:Secreted protein n=1 Tax=Soboliphyme baturini TaxID=241478 RepID=A0A183IXM6_9BILA|nr:unnamed protein product [Soboliphyme baturini]
MTIQRYLQNVIYIGLCTKSVCLILLGRFDCPFLSFKYLSVINGELRGRSGTTASTVPTRKHPKAESVSSIALKYHILSMLDNKII